MKAVQTWIVAVLMSGSASGLVAAPTAPGNVTDLPLTFEANRGQAAPQVRYLARGPGYGVLLGATETVLSRSFGQTRDSLTMRLVGADPAASIEGIEPLPATANYFIGNDPANWRRNIPTYAKVQYRQIYPGIDVVYYGNARQLEYDFVLAPHANPRRIALDFSGGGALQLDGGGNLVSARTTEPVQRRPVAWQEIDGVRRDVDVRYVLRGTRRVGLALGRYDTSRELIIDPLFAYSTYLGGSGNDGGVKIAVDGSGNAYVTGHTTSTNFPTIGAAQPLYGGSGDVFVAKLNAAGTALVYSTYLGGSSSDSGQGIAVDANGKAYVTGSTSSLDFPTTANAAQPVYGGGNDAFLSVLDSTGALAYSTYLGGSALDAGTSVAVDGNGNAFVTGYTQSADFVTTRGALQEVAAGASDAFVTKISSPGAIVYSTYLGGTALDIARGIALDAAGDAYIVGYTQGANFPTTPGALQTAYGGGSTDAFVAALDPSGAALLYSTFLGGSADDYGMSIAVDAGANAYVAGNSNSVNFPLTLAIQPVNGGGVDAFVTALDATGGAQIYSTWLGGSGYDTALGIAVDGDGAAYVTGYTQSANFPVTSNAGQLTFAGGGSDAFITQVTADGAFGYSSYLGGSGLDAGYGIAIDPAGKVYLTGNTASSNFPTTLGVLQQNSSGGGDAFVTVVAASAFDEIFRDGFE